MAAPDKEELDAAYKEAADYWRTAHDEMTIDDNYFWNRLERYMGGVTGIPAGVRLSIPPKAAEVVLRNLNHIPPKALQIIGLPKPGREGIPSQESQARATKRENWLKGAIEYDDERAYASSQLPVTLAAAESMLLRGMAVYKTVEDVNAYEPVRQKGQGKEDFAREYERWARDPRFPYPTTIVDPLAIFLSPSPGEYVIEERKRYRSDVNAEAKRMGWHLESPTKNVTVTWRAHWTPEDVVYLIDGEIVKVVHHGYGFLPFVWGFPGFGSGTLVSGNEEDGPHNIAVSLIRLVRPIILELAFKETQLAFNMQSLAFTRIVAKRNVDIPADPLKTIIYDDERPAYMMPPDKVAELLSVIAKHNDEIDRRTSPIILGGQMPRRVTTATESMVALGESRLVLAHAVAALERMEEVRCEHKLRLLEMASKSGKATDVRRVAVQRYAKLGVLAGHKGALVGAELTGKDVEGYYRVKATISVKNPQEEALRLDTELRKLQAQLQSLTTTAENIGIEDYDGERKQMLVEAFWREGLVGPRPPRPSGGVPSGMPVPDNMAAAVPQSVAAVESVRGAME